MNGGAYTTSIRIEARPADIFPYLTDPELLVRWMGDWAELDPTPGGKFVVDINGVPIRGEYVVVEFPHRVVFSWGAAGSDALAPGSTTVDTQLRLDGDDTVLELAHYDLPADELERHGIGWGHFLARPVVAGKGADSRARPLGGDVSCQVAWRLDQRGAEGGAGRPQGQPGAGTAW